MTLSLASVYRIPQPWLLKQQPFPGGWGPCYPKLDSFLSRTTKLSVDNCFSEFEEGKIRSSNSFNGSGLTYTFCLNLYFFWLWAKLWKRKLFIAIWTENIVLWLFKVCILKRTPIFFHKLAAPKATRVRKSSICLAFIGLIFFPPVSSWRFRKQFHFVLGFSFTSIRYRKYLDRRSFSGSFSSFLKQSNFLASNFHCFFAHFLHLSDSLLPNDELRLFLSGVFLSLDSPHSHTD